ncbi:PilZ domain-containing protein [Desulfopila aestuarii]|uniref:PilZ domain-containing protein n=1 Tax=Desulfopila aestuarii DSM 18488 TaxID=1121416 RepID=A0A1M7YFM1_9BACT|nr:PilZ domain-containing protein [Desulfopila aestuarii]SHO51432.1 PilZ domain-containing protein [Desulfopila aestuarii DSM 18488]
MHDKRKYIRHDAIHLLDYLLLDQGNEDTGRYSMGRTLDVSNNGLKLETAQPFPQGARLKITLGLANELLSLAGTVIYCRAKKGNYISGITFESPMNSNKNIHDIYMKAFHRRRMLH